MLARTLSILSIVALLTSTSAAAGPDREVLELRNTVVNVLQALVQKGVLTREQAEEIVNVAQQRAATEVHQAEATDADASEAVRVTYVPETVRAQITASVRDEVRPLVVEDVMAKARTEQWGIPDALPAWSRRIDLYGDLRVRAAAAFYASDNAQFAYLDFQEVNNSGGIGKAGDGAFLNTTEDRYVSQARLRLGLNARLTDSLDAQVRLTTGNFTTPISTNQKFGNYGNRWTLGVDRAALQWNANRGQGGGGFNLWAGRFENLFAAPYGDELIWDNDLSLEGVAGRYALSLWDDEVRNGERNLFLTLGALPIEEVELSSRDKWLYAAQLGAASGTADGVEFRAALSYYDFQNISGRRNTLDSQVLDYTAPAFVTKGNTLFDIRNDTDPATNLFALAADYQLLGVQLAVEYPLAALRGRVWGSYVQNIGFDEDQVQARTGLAIEGRTDGYELGAGLGSASFSRPGGWRAAMLYRYLQRDAVLDAFTDSDFHLGGTDATGWVLSVDYSLAERAWLRLRYLSANEIDGPPLGIDVLQLDVNGSF